MYGAATAIPPMALLANQARAVDRPGQSFLLSPSDLLPPYATLAVTALGSPVGPAIARDGSLLVTDDANQNVWKIIYAEKK